MTKPYIKDAFDIGILRSDGTTKVGLMLRRSNTEIPSMSVFEDEYLASQFFTGVPGYGALPAEKELAIRQDDWRSGFGLLTYDSDDPKRYHSSIGCDLRFRGMAIAGQKPSTITKPTSGTLSLIVPNADMEANAIWTNGSRSSTQKHAGTYSWVVAAGGSAAYQDLTFPDVYKGRSFTFTCWVHSGGANSGRISIHDGVDETYSSYHTGGSSWEQLSVTKVLSASATQLRILLNGAMSIPIYFDDAAVTEAAFTVGVTNCSCDFNAVSYASFGTILAKLNATGDAFTALLEFGATITDLEEFTDSRLYVALGASVNYCYMSTSEVFTATDSKAYLFKHVGTTIWKALLPRSIYSATDPTADANWSAAVTIDSSEYDILELLTNGTTLIIKKEDRAYSYSGTTVSVLIDETKHMAASTLGRSSTYWQGSYYFGYGLQSLVEYDSGTITWRNPSDSCTDLGEFVGRVQAIAGDERYLYAVIKGRNSSDIDVGSAATDRASTSTSLNTRIDLANAANASGFISSVEVWANATITAFRVGTFYLVSGTTYCCRDSVTLGSITAGSKQTFSGLRLKVESGDFIGCYYATGTLETDTTGGSGQMYVSGEYIDPGDSTSYSSSASNALSLYATGVQTIEVLAGHFETIDSTTQFVWHPIAEITLAGCETAFVSSIYQKRLWIASSSSSDSFYYIPLYANYGNVTSDSNRSYATDGSCYFTTPRLHGNFKDSNKGFIKITSYLGHTYSSNVYWECWYKLLNDTEWTDAGDLGTTQTGFPEASLFIPVDANSNKPISTTIQFKFISKTNSATVTPILLGYKVQAILYPGQRKIIACKIYCANELQLKDGTIDKGSYDTIIATLNEARASTFPFTMYDIEGDTQTVKLLPLPGDVPFWRIIGNEKGRKFEREYSLLMQIVPLS